MSLTKEQQLAENAKKIKEATDKWIEEHKKKAGSNEIQDTLSSEGISQATKDAQQKLSDLFGIPTFDTKGNISTVPTSGIINTGINVGTGKFSNSAFKKSLDKLTGASSDILTLGAKFFNNALLQPISDAFMGLFDQIEIGDLDPIEQAQIKEMQKQIAKYQDDNKALQRQIQIIQDNIPLGADAQFIKGSLAGIKILQDQIDRNERLIDELKTSIDAALKRFRGAKEFTTKVLDLSNRINLILEKAAFTVHDKADLAVLVEQATGLIETILSENIQVAQSDVTNLQIAMKAAAFKMSEQVVSNEGTIDGLLDNALDSLTGVGASIGDAFFSFGEVFVKTMAELFDLSPESIAEAYKTSIAIAAEEQQKTVK